MCVKHLNAILFQHQLPTETHNALFEFRNNLDSFIDAIFAEQKTRDQFGVDVDYIQSEVRRIDLPPVVGPLFMLIHKPFGLLPENWTVWGGGQ